MAAQINKPTVVKMKMNTTISSFAESRWKQVVKTSSSFAPLQMGSSCFIQNCRLQSSHVPDFTIRPFSLGGFDPEPPDLTPVSCMRVLLVKQVHLQNDVDAERHGQLRSAKQTLGNCSHMQKRQPSQMRGEEEAPANDMTWPFCSCTVLLYITDADADVWTSNRLTNV